MEMQKRIIWLGQREKTSRRQGAFNQDLFVLSVHCLLLYWQFMHRVDVICMSQSYALLMTPPQMDSYLLEHAICSNIMKRWEHALGQPGVSIRVCCLGNSVCSLLLGRYFPLVFRILCLRESRSFQKARKHKDYQSNIRKTQETIWKGTCWPKLEPFE